MGLSIELILVTEFSQNCRVVFDRETSKSVIFDPGGEPEKIISFLKSKKLSVEGIYLTHSHIDHCGGVAALLREYKVPLFSHREDKIFRQSVVTTAGMYGLSQKDFEDCPEPDIILEDNSEINILGNKVKIFETPGHSPGSITFWFESENLIVSGDVLFKSSIGRTDLPGGNHEVLMNSIARLIRELPKATRVLSGHGQDTSLEEEVRSNPFIVNTASMI